MLDSKTGRRLESIEHLKQSIAIILTTPLGSRLERRTFGSLLPGLIDAPFNPATRACAAAMQPRSVPS